MLCLPAWIALGLLAPAAGPPAETQAISTRIHFLEMEGLGWREELHGRLTPVSQRGPVTVWTGERFAGEMLRKSATQCIAAPQVVSQAGSPAVVESAQQRPIVAQLKRVADGPIGGASAVAFQPHVEAIEDGLRIQVNGRVMDQGVLAEVSLAESQVTAMHEVTVRDEVKGDSATGVQGQKMHAAYQVPEVALSRVGGEWLIPKDGVLVVSLGARTVSGPEGTPTIHERVVLIEAEAKCIQGGVGIEAGPSALAALMDSAVAPAPVMEMAPVLGMPMGQAIAAMLAPAPAARAVPMSWVQLPEPGAGMPPAGVHPGMLPHAEPVPMRVAAVPTPEGLAHVPMTEPAGFAEIEGELPDLPSRHLPQGYNAEGEPVELPPLPHDPPVTEDPSGQPVGTPQARPNAAPSASDEEETSPLLEDTNVAAAGEKEMTIHLTGGVTLQTDHGTIEAQDMVLRMKLPEGASLSMKGSEGLVIKPRGEKTGEWVAAVKEDARVRTTGATSAAYLEPVVAPHVVNAGALEALEMCPEPPRCVDVAKADCGKEMAECHEEAARCCEDAAECETPCTEMPDCPFASGRAGVDVDVKTVGHAEAGVNEVAEPYRLRLPFLGHGSIELKVRVSRKRVAMGGE